jgi:hypothetical protein
LIGDLCGLKARLQYDFVFGINIGLEPGVPSFNQVEYEHRITEMLQALGKNNHTIEPKRTMKGVAVYASASVNVGGVSIVICAIPREDDDILKKAISNPLFIYPKHIAEIVHFQGDTADLTPNDAVRVLDISANIQPGVGLSFHFKKNMMHITVVYTQNVQPDKNSCLLQETDGFFYVALPLAYYTIQQFEFVNAAFNYSWSPTRHDFRAMLNDFKKNKKQLTGAVDVTMFADQKSSSLFEIICASVETRPPISDDFNIFLKECCRWKETNGALSGSSPKIFFRTLGIFSLQNAIDFACDIRANPNKTYTSLLASYPAGAQIIIQQCMKRLSGNEAYAYIGRNEDVPSVKTAETNEQVDSDDESANQETFVDVMLRLENLVHKQLYHSTWAVSFPADTAPAVSAPMDSVAASAPGAQDTASPAAQAQPAPAASAPPAATKANKDELAIQLLKAYQHSVLKWTFQAVSWINEDGVEANDKLSKILIHQVKPLQLLSDTYTKKFPFRQTCIQKIQDTE